jgi:hypothetical protein
MRVHLPASYGQAAPGIARQAAPRDEDMALVITELVSNAVRHAGGDILLVINDTGGAWRVEVWDTSSDPPRMQASSLDAESRRGLLLVDTLSTTWGWKAGAREQPWAKVVFAEMPAPSTCAAPGAGPR